MVVGRERRIHREGTGDHGEGGSAESGVCGGRFLIVVVGLAGRNGVGMRSDASGDQRRWWWIVRQSRVVAARLAG